MTSNDSLQHVLDRMAIKDVLCRYAKGIDERRFDLVADCYAPDVSFRAPGATLEGREAVVESAKRVSVYKATFHLMANQLVTIDGDTANAETYCLAHHYYDIDGVEQEYILGVRYVDKLARQDGTWRITDRTMHFPISRGQTLLGDRATLS